MSNLLGHYVWHRNVTRSNVLFCGATGLHLPFLYICHTELLLGIKQLTPKEARSRNAVSPWKCAEYCVGTKRARVCSERPRAGPWTVDNVLRGEGGVSPFVIQACDTARSPPPPPPLSPTTHCLGGRALPFVLNERKWSIKHNTETFSSPQVRGIFVS